MLFLQRHFKKSYPMISLQNTFRNHHMLSYSFPFKYISHLLALTFFLTISNLSSGQDCSDVVIPSLPYTVAGTTCGAGNNVGGTNACNAWFLGGEDLVYEFTTTDETCIQIDLTGYTAGAAGIILTSGCPNDMSGNCMGSVLTSWQGTSLSLLAETEPATTYYLTISSDTWIASCTNFELTIETTCPDYTEGDCFGAVHVCDGYLYQEVAPLDDGAYPDILPMNGCQMTNVANEGWYLVNVQADGMLNFTLTPNEDDDYDWALFNLTNATCNDISTDPDLLVSCNTYGFIGSNGETGISSALGGIGSANGPGDLNGPAFNEDLPVLAGETYALMISNWSATTNGYELDFGASTAGFEDITPPVVEDIYYDCSGIHIEFSEYIDCATVLPEHFTIEGPGGPFTIGNLASNCANGASFAVVFLIDSDPIFPSEGGTYQLVFQDDEIADLCGNFLDAIAIPFEVSPGIGVVATTEPAACGNSNGSASVIVTGGNEPLQYRINSGPLQDAPVFNNLLPGEYTITVIDGGDCQGSTTIEVWEESIAFTAGTNGYTCDNTFYTQASLPTGYTGSWSGPPGVEFEEATATQTLVTATTSGEYDLVWTITNNINCTVSESLTVSFSDLGIGGMSFESISCFGACDGSYTVIPSGAANLAEVNYSWSSGTPESDAPHTANSLCAGIHTVTIQTDSGCVLEVPVLLSEPKELRFNEVIVVQESCPGFNDAAIKVISENAVSYSFDGGATYSQSSAVNGLGAGVQHIFVQNSDGCIRDTLVHLLSPAGPEARFDAESRSASIYDPVFQFKNFSQDYATSYWKFGYPDSFGTSNEDEPRFSFREADLGDYVVMLVVKDRAGCVDTTFQTVTIYEDVLNYIPNAFSPNEDGINDIFKPVLRYFDRSSYRMQIFDRWGKMMFETENPDAGWNGSDNGKDYYVEAGVYVYAIRVKSERTGEAVILRGTVTLVR